MKSSFGMGLSFGLTSGVITTLGLIVGLHAGTHSRAAVATITTEQLSAAFLPNSGVFPVLRVTESVYPEETK
jgi:hypothetical protein